jgi:hypothetical protein
MTKAATFKQGDWLVRTLFLRAQIFHQQRVRRKTEL